jgi:hypothetical protein
MFNMTANTVDVRLDANQYARAITRWENEGGAPEHGTSKIGAKRRVKSGPNVENIEGAARAARAPGLVRRESAS